MKKLLIIIPQIFFFFSINGQKIQYNMDTLTVEDGLSHDAVTAIIKDSKGFMWFGTQISGLQRYDGYEWKNYRCNPSSPSSLSSDVTWGIVEDNDGAFWIATSSGLNRLYPDTDLVMHYYDHEDSEHGNDYRFVYLDQKANVWVGTKSSLKHFNSASKTFTRYVLDPDKKTGVGINWPNCVLEDREGTFWVGTSNGGLYKLDRDHGTLARYPIDPTDSTSLCNTVVCLYEDQSGTLWLGTYQGLYMFDRWNLTFTRVLNDRNDANKLENQSIAAIIQDHDGQYWIRTYDGLHLYGVDLQKMHLWRSNRTYPFGSNYGTRQRIRSVYPDSSGILWFSNNWHGIVQLIPSNKRFATYRNHPDFKIRAGGPAYLIENDIICVAQGDVLSKYNRVSKTYELIRQAPGDSNNTIEYILAMHRDMSGNLWVGTWSKGLNMIMQTADGFVVTERFTHDPNDASSISGNRVRAIHEDQQGNLYLPMGGGGIDVLDKKRARISHMDYGLRSPASVLLLEKSGKIWATSLEKDLIEMYGPLEEIDPFKLKPDTVVYHSFETGKTKPLNWPLINALHKANDGTYWLGTQGQGLIKMIASGIRENNVTSYEFEHFSTDDGLSHDHIASILEDDDGRLWLATENGISRFDPDTETFTNYRRKDGLAGRQYSWKGFEMPRGEMFFPCEAGILGFYPDSIVDNPYIPPIVITELKVFNKSWRAGNDSLVQTSFSYVSDIALSFNRNNLSFEFAALNYIHSEQNQYKYKMEGLDEDWTEAGTRRYASYANLKPGEYAFRVIGSNNDNKWNTEGASLNITILPPWWGTIYAYFAYAFIALMMGFGYTRLRTWKIRKERDKLESKVIRRTEQIEAQKELLESQNQKIREMDQMKTRFFTNLSHEFRTPLTMIREPVRDLLEKARLNKKEHGKLQVIARNAQRLLNLINQLLDIAKLESGIMKLKLNEGDVTVSLRNIAGTFSSLAETKGIVYNRLIPREALITLFDPGILEKILTNLLSNAFKFTPEAGEITFSARLIRSETSDKPDQIECVLTDQGPGIPIEDREKIFTRFYQVQGSESTMGTGIGLSLVKDLVQLCHGDISVKSEEGKGSTFIVTLPLGKDHLEQSEYVLVEETAEDKDIQADVSVDSEAERASEKPVAVINGSDKPIVLIVDDNSDIRTHIREHLEDHYKVVESVNGKAGLLKAFDIIPDLVITDLMMPVMDGVELCKQLKRDERTSHVPVIMLTAKATREDKVEGLESGADDYIAKPFDMLELKSRIANLIQQRKKLRNRYSREITLEPKDIAVTPIDEEFLRRAIHIVEERMADENFDMEQFQQAMHMSHSTLFRKLQALTDQSPTVFIRNIRLRRAAQLMRDQFGNVTEVSYEVGFNNPSYFSSCFKELYGVSPMDYTKIDKSIH